MIWRFTMYCIFKRQQLTQVLTKIITNNQNDDN